MIEKLQKEKEAMKTEFLQQEKLVAPEDDLEGLEDALMDQKVVAEAMKKVSNNEIKEKMD